MDGKLLGIRGGGLTLLDTRIVGSIMKIFIFLVLVELFWHPIYSLEQSSTKQNELWVAINIRVF
jgi:hypothetical protein